MQAPTAHANGAMYFRAIETSNLRLYCALAIGLHIPRAFLQVQGARRDESFLRANQTHLPRRAMALADMPQLMQNASTRLMD